MKLLKPLEEIKNMEDDREDIYVGGLIKRYTTRSHKLEHLTLADWLHGMMLVIVHL